MRPFAHTWNIAGVVKDALRVTDATGICIELVHKNAVKLVMAL